MFEFEQLFRYRKIIDRYRMAPLVIERGRFLQHCAKHVWQKVL